MQHGFETALGPIRATMSEDAVVALDWEAGAAPSDAPLGREVQRQINEYLAGERQVFDVSLAPQGSAFQLAFYEQLLAIPFGHTRTYGEIAKDMGVPAQAIGQACGANPIPILIPCHRVLGANGLGGFSARGGVETKVKLLRLEGAASLLI